MKISIDITGKQLADLKELAKGAKTTIGMTAAGIVGLYLEGKLVDKPVGKDIPPRRLRNIRSPILEIAVAYFAKNED